MEKEKIIPDMEKYWMKEFERMSEQHNRKTELLNRERQINSEHIITLEHILERYPEDENLCMFVLIRLMKLHQASKDFYGDIFERMYGMKGLD